MSHGASAQRRLQFVLAGDVLGVMQQVGRIAGFLRDAGCNASSVRQMSVVAEEILLNIQRDAWPDQAPGRCSVDVTAEIAADSVHVELRTEDDGIAFDPTVAEPPDVEASLEERETGGLGILLVRSMTDVQSYQRIDERNIFTVGKICPV